MRFGICFLALLLLVPSLNTPLAAQTPGEHSITFETRDGQSVAAHRGTLAVPEYRGDPTSRMIELSYVRFASTSDKPGPPIVYLAGGPGGSGSVTARGERFALFMAMRAHGDVIAFDQRGTGASTQLPRCVSSIKPSRTEIMSDSEYTSLYRSAAIECGRFWQDQGIDIRGYTTRESVQDLSALRVHLGADKISLWGISYGSHLALAAIAAIPAELDRVILASVEGLDQTVKLPARTDAYFTRLQEAVDAQPAAHALYPDIVGMMRRVHARLEAEPLYLTIRPRNGKHYAFLLQRRHLQELASGLIADPENAALMLALYRSLDNGDTRFAANLIGAFDSGSEAITFNAMSTAMDVASGISHDRALLFECQGANALLGSYLNFPMPQLAGVWPDLDLGNDFRAGPVSDIPVLVLSGTLDGRTYPDGQREAVAGLSNVSTITIVGAGHNLFMATPSIGEAMDMFMRGKTDEDRKIVVEVPDLSLVPDWARQWL